MLNPKYDLHSLYVFGAQKCLIFWNLLGVLINEVSAENSRFILHFKIFRNHSKMFAIFEFIRYFL